MLKDDVIDYIRNGEYFQAFGMVATVLWVIYGLYVINRLCWSFIRKNEEIAYLMIAWRDSCEDDEEYSE